MSSETKNVRGYNVQQLSARRLLASGKPGKTPYQWNMKTNSLGRVMREAAK